MSRERISWIAHDGLAIQNPIVSDDLDRLVAACPLGADDLAVDIGCGTGEFLARLVTRWRCRALGIDSSGLAIQRARRRCEMTSWRAGDGREHGVQPGEATLVASIGATHIFGSLSATLTAIVPLVRTDGLIVVGDGYWRSDPSDTWLAALGATRDELGDRDAFVDAIETAGLTVAASVDASSSDVDAYNDAWRANLERHGREHPDDPEADEIGTALEDARTWHDDCGTYLGFAIFVARRTAAVKGSAPGANSLRSTSA